MKICFVSSAPPRHDGIAAFNQDLIKGLLKTEMIKYLIVAINPDDKILHNYYEKEVVYQIRKEVVEDYVKAAEFINASDVSLVVLELEYALYGGFDGKYVKKIIKGLKKKLVIIVHGLPINSYSRRIDTRKKLFQEISPFVSAFVTINPIQKQVLERWGVENLIVNIFHGAPDALTEIKPSKSKEKLHFQNKLVIFNFGLLHRKKGLEYLIEGYKEFCSKYNDSILIVAGEKLINETNNNYLNQIYALIKQYHLENKVKVINKFLSKKDLYLYLTAADIVVLPYIKRDLVSSGPLSFAVGARKFIITTPFPYAKMLLQPDEAYFVRYKNSADINEGFTFYIKNKNDKITVMLNKLEKKTIKIKWSSISQEYFRLFKRILDS